MEFTESVRSFQVPATPGTTAWPPSFAVGSHFARHARHLGSEHAQLLNHGVHDVRGAQKFAFERAAVHVEPDRLGEIALGHGGDGAGHLGGRPEQVLDQRIDRDFHVVPGAAMPLKADSLAGLAFFAHRQADPLQLAAPSARWRSRSH